MSSKIISASTRRAGAAWRSTAPIRSGGTEGSLLSAIDRTAHQHGRPAAAAVAAHAAVRSRAHHRPAGGDRGVARIAGGAAKRSIDKLDDVCDIERIVGRVAVGRAGPRDLAALGKCLAVAAGAARSACNRCRNATDVAPELDALRPFCAEQAKYLTGAIKPDPAPHLREGGVIADGFDPELDRLRDIGTNSQQWLAAISGPARRRDRHPLAARRLQQSVRLLHRSHRHRTATKPPRPGRASRRSRTPSGTSPMN